VREAGDELLDPKSDYPKKLDQERKEKKVLFMALVVEGNPQSGKSRGGTHLISKRERIKVSTEKTEVFGMQSPKEVEKEKK